MLATPHPPIILKLLAHDLRWRLVVALAQSDRKVQELVQIVAEPMNLVSYHLKHLRTHGLVSAMRSSADGRDVYYRLELEHLHALYRAGGEALHPVFQADVRAGASTAADIPPTQVLFLCTHNSARSQLAEAILRQLGGTRVAAWSAGTEPSVVHPDTLQMLAELHIDPQLHTAKHVDQFVDQPFDYVITVCDRAREHCTHLRGAPEHIHWSFPDPVIIEDAAARAHAFQTLTRQLTTRIQHLLIIIGRTRTGTL